MMRTSAHGTKALPTIPKPQAMARHASGFTLIEILVVLIIISVMGTLTTFSLEHLDQRATEQSIQRLAHALQAAIDRVELQGAPIMAEFGTHTYQFETLRSDGNWVPLTSPAILAAQGLHADISIQTLTINGRHTQPPYRLELRNNLPEFRLSLNSPNGPRVISGTTIGHVSTESPLDEQTERP